MLHTLQSSFFVFVTMRSRHDGVPWRGNILGGESSLVPGFPLRSALISLSVISWIGFDVLHSFEINAAIAAG